MKKYKFIIILIVSVVMFSPKTCNAWWPDLLNAAFQRVLDTAYDQIMGALMGAAKQAAAQAVSKSIQEAVSSGGTSSDESASTMFISNWSEFLHDYPKQKTDLYMNDFFSSVSKGKASSLNYKSNGGNSVGGNYTSQLEQYAKRNIGLEQSDEQSCEISDPETIFQDGDWASYNSLYASKQCNMFGASIVAGNVYVNKLEELKDEARTKAISYQGFKAKTSGDSVITPGSTIKDIQSAAEDLPNKIIAGSTKIPEVITALATRMVVSTIKQGIGNAKAQISKSISSQSTNVQGIINNATKNNPRSNFQSRY